MRLYTTVDCELLGRKSRIRISRELHPTSSNLPIKFATEGWSDVRCATIKGDRRGCRVA